MASSLIRHANGLEFHFPRQEKEKAFAAMELIRHRLDLAVSVVRREDPETLEQVWGIQLRTPGREVQPEELETARSFCELAAES